MDKIRKTNDSAMISIDLMIGLVLTLAAVLMVILVIQPLSQEDRDWRIRQYMTATRATDSLVKYAGEPGWEEKWTMNITKIGFLYIDDKGKAEQKVLNIKKVEALMGEGYPDSGTSETRWWEFPSAGTARPDYENAAKSLGLERYDFYMQLHPVGLENFNSTPLEMNLTNKKGINFDTVSVVDRYVYIVDPDSPDKVKYIKSYWSDTKKNESVHYRLNLWVW